MSELLRGSRYDRYVVEDLLGQGAMARVYRVRHVQLGSQHALKVLTITSSAVRERFRKEGRAQSQLRHPNVVGVTDTIDVDGGPGLVMELIHGPSLLDVIEHRTLTIAQVDVLARGILAGVGAAHKMGIVHRDLKPANILLHLAAEGPVPKVADFGVAKSLDAPVDLPRQTRANTGLGTPAYMAPEQMRDAQSVDARADLFSLGAIFAEMATGQMVFDGDLLTILTNIAANRFVPPRELRPDLPGHIEEAILKCLSPSPDLRFASCAALEDAWSLGLPPPEEPWDLATRAALAAMAPAPPVAIDLGVAAMMPTVELEATPPLSSSVTELLQRSTTSSEAEFDVGHARSLAASKTLVGDPPRASPHGSTEIRVVSFVPPATSQKRTRLPVVLLAIGIGVIAVTVFGGVSLGVAGFVGAAALSPSPPIQPPMLPPLSPRGSPPQVARVDPVAPLDPAEAVDPVERPKPSPKPATAPAPIELTAPVPTEATAPIPKSGNISVVTVAGTAARVYVLDGQELISLPAELPPGTYKVQVLFSNGDEFSQPCVLDVRAGSNHEVACSRVMRNCTCN